MLIKIILLKKKNNNNNNDDDDDDDDDDDKLKTPNVFETYSITNKSKMTKYLSDFADFQLLVVKI